MDAAALLTPTKLGALALPNRLIMAPLTRCRADADHVPTELMVEYYAQRASAGLIIAEATMAIEGNSAFGGREPGIYSSAQVAGWKRITEAVHARGGRMALQLWHGGRACHSLLNGGRQPVAPSALRIENDETHTPQGKKPYEIPRELRDDELPEIIAGFRRAAENAKAAGFDAVEVHGANGYLLDEFLRDGSNRRTGPYGGPIENRARLLLEVTDAVIGVWGNSRVGVRLSPLNSYNDMKDSDPVALVSHVAAQLSARGIAFLDLMRGDFFNQQQADVVTPARRAFHGALLVGMNFTPTEAAGFIGNGTADAIVFGKPFISNPDFVERVKMAAALNEMNSATLYSSGATGYTDYPTMAVR